MQVLGRKSKCVICAVRSRVFARDDTIRKVRHRNVKRSDDALPHNRHPEFTSGSLSKSFFFAMICQKSGRHPELVSGSLLSVSSLVSIERGQARRRLRHKTEYARSAYHFAGGAGEARSADSCFILHSRAPPIGAITDYVIQNLQRPLRKSSIVRLPDRYKFADAACIARQAQGRADAPCDFKWHARGNVSKEKCHGRRKHLKSSIRTPRSTGKFISVGGFFLCFVSFFSREERNEVGAPKARHPA